MAAGLGFKDFVTGEVLTAADVDGYLMQGVWVFASAAARDAAVTSPQEGNFAYLKDTNVTTYYTGSAWANLDTTGMTNPMTTTGDTIYSSSGSTPARLGIGSTGDVLTVAGGVPSWAAPAGGGGMTSLASGSIAASATGFDLTSISSAYNELWLYISDISVDATGVGYGIDLKINNDTGNNYSSTGTGSAGVLSYSASNEWKLAVQEDALNDHSILLRIPNYANTTSTKIGQWVSHDYYAGAAAPRALSGVWTATPAAINRLTLVIDVGAFDNGTYNLYGVK